MLGFYKVFQPDTILQYEKMGGKGNKAAEALIQFLARKARFWREACSSVPTSVTARDGYIYIYIYTKLMVDSCRFQKL